MIEMAQRRAPFNNLTVDFVSADILAHRALDYDVLMTHFFLDVFNQNCFKKVFRHLNKMLLKNGVCVNTEFVSSNSFIRSIFIRFMYLFLE